MAESDSQNRGSGGDWREFVTVALLSVTAILTAWTGFQASKWGGAMSISFSQASTARLQAARHEGVANRKQTIQVSLFTQWLQAYQAEDDQLSDFLIARFPEPLATTFPQWVAAKPLQNPDAPSTPFDLPDYQIPELREAQEADERADAKFAEALENNQRGDNYTILTVAFATVLFLIALSSRMRSARAQWALLTLGSLGFLITAGFLFAYPKLL